MQFTSRRPSCNEAMLLPPRSAALADYVITCLNEYNGCDEALRQKAYWLFGVPTGS